MNNPNSIKTSSDKETPTGWEDLASSKLLDNETDDTKLIDNGTNNDIKFIDNDADDDMKLIDEDAFFRLESSDQDSREPSETIEEITSINSPDAKSDTTNNPETITTEADQFDPSTNAENFQKLVDISFYDDIDDTDDNNDDLSEKAS